MKNHPQIKVGIVGGSGYTGAELMRLLLHHPHATVTRITSRAEAGTAVADLFPHLHGWTDLQFTEPDEATLADCDAVFFATPNGTAMQMAPALLAAGVRIIDLAADFRLKREADWQRWYGIPHACPDWLAKAVYGLPEMNRQAIRQAALVANPGCYPTAVQLGFLPLLESQLIELQPLIADAKSGVSGAGRKAAVNLLLAETNDNFKAYSVSAHRHWPEIYQGLVQIAQQPLQFTFVPHLVPMIRGIHATLYGTLNERGRQTDLSAHFAARYAAEPFVEVLPAGSHPETRFVRGSNRCQIAVHRPNADDTVVVLVVIDNLVKGAAGQAVQNFNLMFGLAETTGLEQIAVLP